MAKPKRERNVSVQLVSRKIFFLREMYVMLDADLAALYRVTTSQLNRAVQRNRARFPEDFMFQLNREEIDALRFHIGMSKRKGRGGRRYAHTPSLSKGSPCSPASYAASEPYKLTLPSCGPSFD